MRVVHYVNQFFGQLGGEEAAHCPLEVREEAVGPGKILQSLFGKKAEIVATIVCGDNYFTENSEAVSGQIVDILKRHRADLVVAGPAFNAGRYGMACGEVCKIAQQHLGLKAVSGMYEENPGVELFKMYGYIFPTANQARGMKPALDKMAAFIIKLADNREIADSEAEGYFPRGVRRNVWQAKTGAQRAVDMALAKVAGKPFKTELPMPKFTRVQPSKPIKDIKSATIAVMTTGGIVPKGNPDRLEALASSKWVKYRIADVTNLGLLNCEVAHGGYDPSFANEDPNRVLPIDAMIELEKQGKIGKLHPYFYVTVGNGMPIDRATMYGDAIGSELLKEGQVAGVILTST